MNEATNNLADSGFTYPPVGTAPVQLPGVVTNAATIVIVDPPAPQPLPPQGAEWQGWDIALRAKSLQQDKELRDAFNATMARQAQAAEDNYVAMRALLAAEQRPKPGATDYEMGLWFTLALLNHGISDCATKAKYELALFKTTFPKTTAAPK